MKKLAIILLFLFQTLQGSLLPEDHPVKETLDSIFSKSRVLLSIESMKGAGFSPVKPRKVTRLIVTSHSKTPGYIYKVYLDTQYYYKGVPELTLWQKRIAGAQKIRTLVNDNNWGHLFKIPQKWAYKLPKKPSPPKEFLRKDYILVEEDMELLSAKENKLAWKNPQLVTEELLKALCCILKEVGLSDCVKIDNIPFSKDGRVAFIDTQSFDEGTPSLSNLSSSLPKERKAYWKSLK